MLHIVTEQVFVYREEQYDAWKRGDRSLLPYFIERLPVYDNQPRYHFGEIFVIDTFNRLAGWKAFHQFTLSPVEPNNPTYAKSRQLCRGYFRRTDSPNTVGSIQQGKANPT